MELLTNESPPTGVLNSNMLNETVNTNSNRRIASTIQQSAAGFTNSGALSVCENLSTTNNLNSGFSSSSLRLALGSNKFQNSLSSSLNSSSSTNLKNDLICSISERNSKPTSYLTGESTKFENSKHCLSDLNSIHNLINHNSLNSPVSNSTNSIKSSSSSYSSSSNLCFNSNCNNSVNLNGLNSTSSNLNSNLNSNLCSNLSSNLSNNLNSNLSPNLNSNLNSNLNNNSISNSTNLFCAQQLFNSSISNQQKVKRTRQRVDAGEPRNSYASIANYATNRLGKVPNSSRNYPTNLQSKGLFDQLGYLGLSALLTNNSFSPDDFISNSFVNNSNLVNSPTNSSPANSSINSSINNNLNNNSISSLLATLASSDRPQTCSPSPLFNSSGQFDTNVACLSAEQQANKLTNQQQMILNQSFNWNTNNHQLTNKQSDTVLSAGTLIEQQSIDNNMAKSRFSEDPVTLDFTKVSKHSEFDNIELPNTSNSPMTPNNDLSVKQTMEQTTSDEIEKIDQQNDCPMNDQIINNPTPDLKEENDENNKNRENNQMNKSPQLSASNSRSNSQTSSRCSSPTNEQETNNELINNTDSSTNELSKVIGNRMDNLNNLNLVTERLNNNNSNSSCTTGSLSNDLSNVKNENGTTNKMNGNCKGRRRKLDQPQQLKADEDEKDMIEINQMNEMNDKDDPYKEDLDDEMDEEMDDSYSTNQQIEDLRKTNLDIKAFQTILQQLHLQQQQQQQQMNNNPLNQSLNSQLNNQLNNQLTNQLNQQLNQQLNNQINNQINNNLRSTRVSDRGRMNGQAINSSNNSANSTPVNLSINSPRPDDDEYLTNNSRNQEFYDSSAKLDLDSQFNSLASNLCKEFSNLFDDFKAAISSRKLLINLQDNLRARFDQFLNGNGTDRDLEQFFNSTKEHLTNKIVQLIDTNFQSYKMKVLIQNFNNINGQFNNNSFNNNFSINQTSQINQSSKNLSAMSLNKQSKSHQIRSNSNLNSSNELRSSNLVDQLSSRLQRSSPNLLAGLDVTNNLATSKLLQNFNSNLNTNLNPNFNDFKTPFTNFLPDNNLQSLSLVSHLLHAQEELELQKQLQKENQQDSALSLMAPKRKRIKASDEPRRTRTSNRLPQNAVNTLNPISSLNSITNQTIPPPKSTSEMLASIVSRELNNTTPLAHNLNHSTNTSLSNVSNNQDTERETTGNHQSTNNSINSSVFPFNNSFINSLAGQTGELDVQQLMLAVNNGLNNGQNNSNRASPLSSFGLSSGQAPFLLDQSPDNSLSSDLDGATTESTTTLSPVHLRKAKLMFFYVRYPSSNLLKSYFRDIKFHKNNTAQLVKWFSNFREFYYQQIDKYARQELSNGRQKAEDIIVPSDSELLKVLNVHYNRQNHISVPDHFRFVVEQTVREFFRAIQAGRDDNEPSWRKPIYKVIARLDATVPECFRQSNFLEALESNSYTEFDN